MKFIEIFETNDEIIFAKIIELYNTHKIHYQTFYEYKLYKENNHGEMEGGAIIRVFQKDLIKAYHLLISNGYKKHINHIDLQFKFIRKLLEQLNKIPILNSLSLPIQLLVFFFFAISLPFLLFLFFVLL